MRVLHVLPNLDPEVGGPATSDVWSCIAAQRAGIETTALIGIDSSTAERADANLEILRSNGVAVHVLQTGFRSLGRRYAIVFGLNRKINALGDEFDLSHLHSPA